MTPAELVSQRGWEHFIEGDEIRVSLCPFCRAEGTFSINAESGLWNCWRANRCGKKGNLRQIQCAFPIKGNETASRPTATKTSEPEPLPTAEDLRQWHSDLSDNFELYDWLTDVKGWSESVINRMNLGLTHRWFAGQTSKGEALAMPYYSGGQLVTVKFRNLMDVGTRFSFLKGRPAELYNVDSIRANEPIIICEGESDCLALLSSDWRNRDLPVVAIPGAMNAKAHWRPFFEPASERILVFDNDDAGDDGITHFVGKYRGLTFRRVKLPSKYKDLSEWLLDPDSKQRSFESFCRAASITL